MPKGHERQKKQDLETNRCTEKETSQTKTKEKKINQDAEGPDTHK